MINDEWLMNSRQEEIVKFVAVAEKHQNLQR